MARSSTKNPAAAPVAQHPAQVSALETAQPVGSGAVLQVDSQVKDVPPINDGSASHVTISLPLPKGASTEDLKTASIVVTSKSPQGRRRAGMAFTREETLIPYVDLDDEQIAALTGDPELIVGLRLTKPD